MKKIALRCLIIVLLCNQNVYTMALFNPGSGLMQPTTKRFLLATIITSLVCAGSYIYTKNKQHKSVLVYNSKQDANGSISAIDYTPENSIIVFDLHKVLFGQDFYTIVKKVVSRNPRLYYYLLSPWFLYKLITLTSLAKDPTKGVTIETIFDEISKAYPEHFSTLKQDLITALNEEPLYTATIVIAQQLKKMGYTLFLLSNIAPETWDDLKKKHAVFNNLFDGVFIPTQENCFIRKPDPMFYQKFNEYLKQQGFEGKTVVFIDDRKKNVTAAGSTITGIVFTNAQQLREQLKKLTIALPDAATQTGTVVSH